MQVNLFAPPTGSLLLTTPKPQPEGPGAPEGGLSPSDPSLESHHMHEGTTNSQSRI